MTVDSRATMGVERFNAREISAEIILFVCCIII
jgi:hypothetical protein